jgi:hypothetical protein
MASACDFHSGKEESQTRVSKGPSASTTEVDIHSSLEGMAELPRHLRWTATISLPAEQIKKVRFLVDRQRLWLDAEPPYSYGEEGAFLATSYFYDPYYDKQGAGHRFTVRVEGMTKGSAWSETVVARVQMPRTARDAPTYGIWGRLPHDALTNPRPARQVGPYTAWLHMVGEALWVGRTVKHAYIYELSASRRRFRVGVPIFLGSHNRAGDMQGWFFKGYQCAPDGPAATYVWSWTEPFGPFNERHLVLKAKDEPCPKRRGILEGVWELLDRGPARCRPPSPTASAHP